MPTALLVSPYVEEFDRGICDGGKFIGANPHYLSAQTKHYQSNRRIEEWSRLLDQIEIAYVEGRARMAETVQFSRLEEPRYRTKSDSPKPKEEQPTPYQHEIDIPALDGSFEQEGDRLAELAKLKGTDIVVDLGPFNPVKGYFRIEQYPARQNARKIPQCMVWAPVEEIRVEYKPARTHETAPAEMAA